MISESHIRKLTDYILLNSASTSSAGIYNGKAGVAITLFEVAKVLHDEYIEEQAFLLLQESLLTKNKDVGFGDGLCGIGYVFAYLLRNRFVDADFYDLFGDKHNLIIAEIRSKMKASIVNISDLYYLSIYSELDDCDDGVSDLIDGLHDQFKGALIGSFHAVEQDRLTNQYNKHTILNYFEEYLFVCLHCSRILIDSDLLDGFYLLYNNHTFSSNLKLEMLLQQDKVIKSGSCNTTCFNRSSSLAKYENGLNEEQYNFSQLIDILYLSEKLQITERSSLSTLKTAFKKNLDTNLETYLINKMGINPCMYGYKTGVSKLLLYLSLCRGDNFNHVEIL